MTEPKPWRVAAEKGYLSSLVHMEREDDRSLDFHGAFIPAVAEDLILRHTKPGDWVWDCFAGSGTTRIVAATLGRRFFLSDLNPTLSTVHKADARDADIRNVPVLMETDAGVRISENAPGMLGELGVSDLYPTFRGFQLVVCHPPYHDIIRFSDNEYDLSNCESVAHFLDEMDVVFRNVLRHLKVGGYVGLVIGDVWITREKAGQGTDDKYGYCPLGFLCADILRRTPGITMTACQVKDIKGHAQHHRGRENLKLARVYQWGSVVFNHEYIFSFRKEK